MDHDHDREDELEKHSLPGTNQAGKGPESCEDDRNEERPTDEVSPPDQPEKRERSR